MIGRTATANGSTRRLVTFGAGALALTLVASGCVSFYEIPIETPIKAKLDLSPFQRVHVVGFIAAARTTSTPTSRRSGCSAASSARGRACA